MIRRGWTALIVTALGLGLFAAHSGVRVHADNAPRITNISVAVDDSGHVSYGMCVVAAAPPSSGTVIVEGPYTSTTQVGASFTYDTLSCGEDNGTAYFMHASFSAPLAAGSYTFDAAAVDEPDGSGATLGRYSGFRPNFAGDEVWNSCTVDFDTGRPSAIRNCSPPHNTGGVMGDLTAVIVPGPTPTPTHVPTATKVPTNTPVPTATKAPTRTPVPTATTTPVPPTATQGNVSPGITPTAAPTRTPQAAVTSAPASTPISTPPPTNTPLVVVVSTVGAATATPATAHLSPLPPLPGPALHATVLEPLVRPGATEHIAVSYVAHALVQATVGFPGVRPFALRGRTGIHGRLVLTVTVPRTLKLSHGRATARVTVSAVSNNGRRQVTRVLSISDMVVSVTVNAIVNCVQIQTVHVVYHPNTPLRVVLLFPHGRHLTLSTRADRHGNAMVQARVTYVHADSPVRIGVQARDATAGAQRMESTAISVALPTACQKAPAAAVTIGD
jgi:hypothetical protein